MHRKDKKKWMKYCLEKFITDCDKELLQIATAHFITNCDKGYYKLRQIRYYKLRQVLLQIATGITNCDDRYYKLRQVLQIATLLQIATVHARIRKQINPTCSNSRILGLVRRTLECS